MRDDGFHFRSVGQTQDRLPLANLGALFDLRLGIAIDAAGIDDHSGRRGGIDRAVGKLLLIVSHALFQQVPCLRLSFDVGNFLRQIRLILLFGAAEIFFRLGDGVLFRRQILGVGIFG